MSDHSGEAGPYAPRGGFEHPNLPMPEEREIRRQPGRDESGPEERTGGYQEGAAVPPRDGADVDRDPLAERFARDDDEGA